MKAEYVDENLGSTRKYARGILFRFFEWFGELGVFSAHLFRSIVTPPYEGRELVRQMDEIGSKSLPLVLLAGAAMGVVMTLHTRESLIRFGAKAFLPAVLILSVIKETGPIITALVLAGRVGAGIGSELGSMKVTEQIDAIEASAVDPYRYLVATRVMACVLMLPLLTIAADFSGIIMGWFANCMLEPISLRAFMEEGFRRADFSDLLPTTGRASVFGLLIGLIGCFQGMRTEGGTEGVGRSATSAVVLASLLIILADVVLVRLIMLLF